ncbi:MAG: membrane AbrB-like protein [Gammaproteobacteria bacterium]
MVGSAVSFMRVLAIGGAGGFVASSIGIAGGWLLGAVGAIVAAAALQVPLSLPVWLRRIAMGFAGITVGAAITAQTVELLSLLLQSVAIMLVFLVILVLATYLLHRYRWGMTRATALACAWPGNVLLVFIGAEAMKANMQQVAVVQSVRVLALMGLLPLTIGMYYSPVAGSSVPLSVDLGLAVMVSLFCVVAAVRLGLVGGEMFLTAFAVGALSGLGMLQIEIPREAIMLFQVVVGSYIGLELAKLEMRAVLSALKPSLASALLAATATIVTAFVLAQLFDYSAAALALALAPGGAEAMILLSVAFGVDPAFVGIHHTVRLVVLTLAFPLALRWASREDHQATGSR